MPFSLPHSFPCSCEAATPPRFLPLSVQKSAESSIVDSVSGQVVVNGRLHPLLGALPKVGAEFGLPYLLGPTDLSFDRR